MELFGRELSLGQMIGLVECHATPDKDLVHCAALEIIAALRESQRRAQDARNELCLKCGRYHEAHNGACDGCRWMERIRGVGYF